MTTGERVRLSPFERQSDQRAECQWIKPVLVGQFEFTERTPDSGNGGLSGERYPNSEEKIGSLK
jgi:hypothetical protein